MYKVEGGCGIHKVDFISETSGELAIGFIKYKRVATMLELVKQFNSEWQNSRANI